MELLFLAGVGEYRGHLENGKRHGTGRQVFDDDGEVYEGQWLDDCMSGQGVYRYVDGGMYDGEWFDDQQHGYGVSQFPDGEKYEGHWHEGKQHGVGV